MKALLIGMGSIAQKHLAALWKLDPGCEVVALRSGKSDRNTDRVQNVYSWDEVPEDLDFVMICNPTSEHYNAIDKCAGLGVPLFIEKPPLMNLDGADRLIDKLRKENVRTYTAFPFRFHPVIQWLQQELPGKRVLEVQAYCGSYLPDWRPDRDYRDVYSARQELGGGVHLDLIHEIDYLTHLFGAPLNVKAFRSKVSDLDVTSCDVAHYWMHYKSFHASVLLNYYRRDPKRSLEIVMDQDTWTADLIHSRVTDSKGGILFADERAPHETFHSQMRYFLEGLDEDGMYMNSLAESLKTLEYCLADH